MDATDTPLIIVLAVLLVCSAFASASETALFGVTHGQRATLGRSNPHLSRMVESLLARPRELLMQVLLLNMVVNVAYFIVTSVLTIHAEKPLVRVLISVVSLFSIILMGEVFAKLFASSATLLFLRIAAPAHLLIRRPISGVLRLMDVWVVSPLARLVAPRKTRGQDHVTPEQLGVLIDLGAGDGVIDHGEQQLLTSIVELGHLRVEQIMTPRVDLSWVSPSASTDELLERCRRSQHSRLLVCDGDPDQGVLGVVDARRVFEGQSIEQAMRPVLYVPEQSRLDMLMDQLRRTGHRLAVCVDEHGGVSGIVTITDIVKELIEGLEDPGDAPASEVETLDARRWIVPARLPIRDWAVMFSDRAVLEHAKHVNTLGGLVMVLLDRIPEPGDRCRIGEIELRVDSMSGRAIDRIEVTLLEDGSDSGSEGSS